MRRVKTRFIFLFKQKLIIMNAKVKELKAILESYIILLMDNQEASDTTLELIIEGLEVDIEDYKTEYLK